MKRSLAVSLLLATVALRAQTVDSVRVSPPVPTTLTNVKVYVYGFFSSLTSFVSATSGPSGPNTFQVDITRCQGPATAIDYTKDSVSLGLLPAGVYTVNATMYSAFQDMQTGQCLSYSATGNGSTTFTVTQSLGVAENRSARPSVAYNAHERTIRVELPSSYSSCKFILLDLSGRPVIEKLMESKNANIKVEVPQGLYFVKLFDCPEPLVKKMVIN